MLNDLHLKEWVAELLTTRLPKNCFYHDLSHTLYVTEKAMEIAAAEAVNEQGQRLLYAAALLHDSGYISTYKGHEHESCRIARENLPSFGYADPEIERISTLIMATRIPQEPADTLQDIICDADLEYLGTENAELFSAKLFRELQASNPEFTAGEWKEVQISFISSHRYHTDYCKNSKEFIKQRYLQSLMHIQLEP